MTPNNQNILIEIKQSIVALRRGKDIKTNWPQFRSYVFEHIEEICELLDTRWLVSIADTFVDFGSDIEKRNAMYISLLINMEKFWATNLLMYDIQINPKNLEKLQNNEVIPLWDGMFSMNINRGEMANNLFGRIYSLMSETPELDKILRMVISRLHPDNTTLGNLSKYHKKLFSPPKKRSLVFAVFKRLRIKLKQYKIFV